MVLFPCGPAAGLQPVSRSLHWFMCVLLAIRLCGSPAFGVFAPDAGLILWQLCNSGTLLLQLTVQR